jgi:threonine/homoserine/homoserine lactone efflux protein
MAFSLLTIFCTSFIIALSGALMPGPLFTVTVTESTRRGPIAGPLMILGHGILELALIAALLMGLAPFLVRNDVFVFISLTGGSVLLWMGISMLRSLPELRLEKPSSASQSGNLIVAGIVLSAINPYWLIWWASIGIGYIMQSITFGILGIAAFFIGHILADLAWYSFISFSAAKGSHFLDTTVYRRLIGGCGVFLIFFSGWFFYSGLVK